MGEIGLVVGIDANMVTVKLNRTEACAKCRACTVGLAKDEMLIKAFNLCSAKIDDYVNVELESKDFLMAVIIMYGTPFTAFIIGVSIGFLLTRDEIFSFLVGIVFICLAYLIIKKNENYFKSKNYLPSATEIVTNEQPPL